MQVNEPGLGGSEESGWEAGDRVAQTGDGGRPAGRPPRPLPVLVLADVSGSMGADGKMETLNRSVAAMFAAFASEDSVRGEIQVAVIVFGGESARLHLPLTAASAAGWTAMQAGGRTPLGGALDMARELLEDSVSERAFQPTLVLVSDGVPTDDWEEPLHRLLATKQGARAQRIAVGIGSDRMPDAEKVLESFTSAGLRVLRADEVGEIAGYFRWITLTVTDHLRTGRPAPRLDDLESL